jgi:hypothetical protein
MGNLLAGIVSGFIGGALAAAAAFTLVSVSSGPTPDEVASERQNEQIDSSTLATDIAYGNR